MKSWGPPTRALNHSEGHGLSISVTGQMNELVEKGGKILACGTCLKIRNSEGT